MIQNRSLPVLKINPSFKTVAPPPLFRSFFWGGFECAAPTVAGNKRLDLLRDTKHDIYCQDDYRLIKELDICTVREGFAWHEIDKGKNRYDFSRYEPMLKAAAVEGIQQIWDLCHYDYPAEIDPFTDEFIHRFARYAQKAAKKIRQYTSNTIFIVPINEISFWAHMGGSIGVWGPHAITRGYALKKQLVKASIAAMKAVWDVDMNVRFIQVDPLMHKIVKKPSTIVKETAAAGFKEIKYQAFDMLAGRLQPELGGHPKFLDLIGVNYYITNQDWLIGDDPFDETCHEMIPWNSKYRISFADMLQEVYDRYRRPIIITETGAWGSLREQWWKRTFKEVSEARNRGIPVLGICAYPVVDRPDWTEGHLTNSGLWDFKNDDPLCRRVPHQETIDIVKKYIQKEKSA